MRIKVLSLFPKMFDGILNESIIKRAIDDKKVNIDVIDLRSYSKDKHNKVDDTIYGEEQECLLNVNLYLML